ncbi:hypothetical protein ACJMK2_025582 [Sinanodonta woodiana]|uniref:C-type lectin domain-containing protein n=1 Tax=Sinanodonta woodiana TaxID=1069815 RepID=A0ABD3XHG4_SINWO
MATASSVKTTPAVINHTTTTRTTTRTTMRTMTITTVTKSISTRAPDHACSGADYFQTNITHLCIKIHREAVNFTTAERKCQNEHAHLVQIDNVLKVIDIARNLAHSHDSRYFWIGLADIYHNKSLYWLNREPMTYNNFLQHSLHTMHLSTGFAVMLDSTYRRNIWTATNAENLSGFICEMPVASSVNLNQSINAVCNGSEGFQMDSSGSACVKMVTDIRLTWIDALSYCKKIKSHFVILSDHHKHEEVMEIIGDKNLVYDFWFGLHAVNGTWYWGSSSRVQWTKWQSGHPGAYQESDACAVLWQSEWFATSCNDTRHFICERYIL